MIGTAAGVWQTAAMPDSTASPLATDERSLALLREVFGYDRFRGQQQEIIAATLAGRDSLVLMPTGGGKSLCYQIPALLRPGLGIVVSPLIALMEDQVSALRELGEVRFNPGTDVLDAGR